MTENERTKMARRIMVLSFVPLLMAIACLIIMALNHMMDSILYPICMTVFLSLYWLVSDVLDVIWLKRFEGKTAEDKKNYYAYSACNFIGLMALVYFLTNMSNMYGVIAYVVATVMKRRFLDDFEGNNQESSEEDPDVIDSEASELPQEEVQTPGIAEDKEEADPEETDVAETDASETETRGEL